MQIIAQPVNRADQMVFVETSGKNCAALNRMASFRVGKTGSLSIVIIFRCIRLLNCTFSLGRKHGSKREQTEFSSMDCIALGGSVKLPVCPLLLLVVWLASKGRTVSLQTDEKTVSGSWEAEIQQRKCVP